MIGAKVDIEKSKELFASSVAGGATKRKKVDIQHETVNQYFETIPWGLLRLSERSEISSRNCQLHFEHSPRGWLLSEMRQVRDDETFRSASGAFS